MDDRGAARVVRGRLEQLDTADDEYAIRFVEALLDEAAEANASDVHLQPREEGLDVRWRLDGVLQPVGNFPQGEASDVIARLKVLAGLLTYRTETPQEGRLRREGGEEMRVSTFPTIHGERTVVRLFATEGSFVQISDLGLCDQHRHSLSRALESTSGAIVICGPAGSGKTTTAYACLRHVMHDSRGRRSVMTLEDPVEARVEGAAQSQVHDSSGFTLEVGLRSVLRQDPEVLLVGEIRDRTTAEAVIGASLTGHLVLSTFHAVDCIGALGRLLEMGIEPYLVRSGLRALLSQRLLRRICGCGRWSSAAEDALGIDTPRVRVAVGCDECLGAGYQGRLLLAEMLETSADELGPAILDRAEREVLAAAARSTGMTSLLEQAVAAVGKGETSASEVRRVFGFSFGNDGKPPLAE